VRRARRAAGSRTRKEISLSVTALRGGTFLPDAIGTAEALRANVASVVRGKDRQVMLVLAAFVARGHVLLEDVPGTAKTVLARAIGQSIRGATASRIQCTPDLQPSDVTGISKIGRASCRERV